MADSDADLIRELYDRWLRGEKPRDLIAEDLEYVNPPEAIDGGVRHDRSVLGMLDRQYDDFRVVPSRIEGVGEGRVLVIAHLSGVSRTSGVPMDWDLGFIWTVRDGKGVRFEWFRDPADAIRAAGLEP